MEQTKQIKSSFQQIVGHAHFRHFLAYCISYIVLGQVLNCLGPMFPYLSVAENRLETQYSFLFSCRAFGYISGSLLVKYIGKRITLHQFIAIGIVMQGVFSILFNTTESIYIKGLNIYLASIGASFQDVNINIATLECFKGDNLAVWLQVIHGCFGVGSLIGPFLVYMFQLNTLIVLGITSLIIASLYYYLETPQKMNDVKAAQQTDEKEISLPKASIYLISFCFFFAVGQECSYGGWISSYAVLWGFSTKEHATFYSSLFWISCTAFRFILAFLKGKPSQKIKALALIGIASRIFGYFIIFYIHSEAGLIIMSFLLGLSNSVLFPLFLTIPQQFGFKLTQSQGTIFVVWAALGEGCLAVGIGKMMGWFSYNWLIYGAILFNVALIIANKINHDILQKQTQYYQQDNKLRKFIASKINQPTPSSRKQVEMSQMASKQ